MNIEKFTELRRQRNVSIEECATVAGITRQHFTKCLKEDKLKVCQVKELCKLLRCKHSFFFEE